MSQPQVLPRVLQAEGSDIRIDFREVDPTHFISCADALVSRWPHHARYAGIQGAQYYCTYWSSMMSRCFQGEGIAVFGTLNLNNAICGVSIGMPVPDTKFMERIVSFYGYGGEQVDSVMDNMLAEVARKHHLTLVVRDHEGKLVPLEVLSV